MTIWIFKNARLWLGSRKNLRQWNRLIFKIRVLIGAIIPRLFYSSKFEVQIVPICRSRAHNPYNIYMITFVISWIKIKTIFGYIFPNEATFSIFFLHEFIAVLNSSRRFQWFSTSCDCSRTLLRGFRWKCNLFRLVNNLPIR